MNGIRFDAKELLEPPVGRAAYSDRTAWLMAEMSRLAYLKFEGRAAVRESLVNDLAELTDKAAIEAKLQEVERFLHSSGDQRDALEAELSEADFKLVRTFNSSDTQAFLATREQPERVAVLAFRGTEASFRDIKTDLNARFFTKGTRKVHNGFLKAFGVVQAQIRAELKKIPGHKLYITGHSLGGALAIVAAHEINADTIAACYTFGSPKVGNLEFGEDIKPPIYRVVNSADLVPRVPPTWAIEATIFAGKLVPIPWFRNTVVRLLTRFRGYRHVGDMRYLTVSKDDFSDVRLIPNLNIIDRTVRLAARLSVQWEAGATDHKIDFYCGKLKAHAKHRLKN